jgi:hypothetical protein
VIGYCWHGKVAWRVKSSGELAVAPEITRDEYHAMVEYTNEMELLGAQLSREGVVVTSIPTTVAPSETRSP